jgi:glycosyltransferase involved in cell wall biosynthesis
MMDQEPVTGGCHYSFGCDGYQQQCGNCPLLARPFPSDQSRQVFLRKQRHLSGLPITFVAPTSWAEEKVRASAIFGGHHVERIALAIDTAIFRPGDRAAARAEFGIPPDKRVVFFGSSYLHEPRKGSAYLIEALKRLHRGWQGQVVDFAGRSSGADTVLFVMAGQNGEELKGQLPFPSLDLGYLRDERRLAFAYQAADVFVCPSIEDAGPMMVPESLLCGTPVVAFNTGGAPDLIVSGQTGYLARACDAADLAWGIERLLESPDPAGIREAASNEARRLHEPKLVAARYVELVSRLLEGESTRRTAA